MPGTRSLELLRRIGDEEALADIKEILEGVEPADHDRVAGVRHVSGLRQNKLIELCEKNNLCYTIKENESTRELYILERYDVSHNERGDIVRTEVSYYFPHRKSPIDMISGAHGQVTETPETQE